MLKITDKINAMCVKYDIYCALILSDTKNSNKRYVSVTMPKNQKIVDVMNNAYNLMDGTRDLIGEIDKIQKDIDKRFNELGAK